MLHAYARGNGRDEGYLLEESSRVGSSVVVERVEVGILSVDGGHQSRTIGEHSLLIVYPL
jgi:hypothetical protein